PSVAVTSTASESCPTSSLRSTLVWVSTSTFTDEIWAVLKPLNSAFTWYVPGSRRSLTYLPELLVTTMSVVLRSLLVTVAFTPGRAAPVESWMVPAMLPYTACALAGGGAASTASARTDKSRSCPRLRVMKSLLLSVCTATCGKQIPVKSLSRGRRGKRPARESDHAGQHEIWSDPTAWVIAASRGLNGFVISGNTRGIKYFENRRPPPPA